MKQNQNISKPSFVAVIGQLTKRGFTTKYRDKVNDDRLGIKLSLTNDSGKYIEVYEEATYWHLLHYGFENRYLPIGFDILTVEDVVDYGLFLEKL